MVKFSLLLILIAVIILGITIAPALSPNNSTILNLLQPILCQPGETLTQQVSPLSRNTPGSLDSFVTDTSLSCKPPTGALINVTDKLFGIGMIGFLVFLVFGVLFLVIGLIRNGSRGSRAADVPTTAYATPFYTPQQPAAPATNPYATQVSVPRQQPTYGGYPPSTGYSAPVASAPAPSEKFDFDAGATMMSIPKPPTTPAPTTTPPRGQQTVVHGAESSELTKRLKQLRDAHEAGLISQEEYDRSKSNLLHDFTDDD